MKLGLLLFFCQRSDFLLRESVGEIRHNIVLSVLTEGHAINGQTSPQRVSSFDIPAQWQCRNVALDAGTITLRRGTTLQTFRGMPNPGESVPIWDYEGR